MSDYSAMTGVTPARLEALRADRDRWKARAEAAEEQYILYMKAPVNHLVNDYCYWKKRAEALEGALKVHAPCDSCINECTGNIGSPCENCQYWLEGPGSDNWQFDQARFEGEGEAQNG